MDRDRNRSAEIMATEIRCFNYGTILISMQYKYPQMHRFLKQHQFNWNRFSFQIGEVFCKYILKSNLMVGLTACVHVLVNQAFNMSEWYVTAISLV